MKHTWKNYSSLLGVSFLCIFIATISLIWFTILTMADYNKVVTNELIIESKNTYMRETVDNFIIRIETLENGNLLSMQVRAETLRRTIEQSEILDLEYLINIIEIHNHDTYQLSTLIYDKQSLEEVYKKDTHTHTEINLADKIESIRNEAAIVAEVEAGPYNIILHVNWEDIYNITKAKIYDEIHNMKYDKNQYMWVNEIVNYDGGDDYAFRVINPNLPETEGGYISTNYEDGHGNFPYAVQLNSLKENGEVNYRYYFKNLMDDNIAEKIAYARLYEKYDWVIATGIPLEDLEIHAANIDKNSIAYIIRNTMVMIAVFSIGFIGIVYFLLKHQRKYLLDLEGFVKEETEIDMLTGAFTRKYGDEYLKELFSNFTRTGISSTVFLLDIDDFKLVNDTYGHATGDIVLKKITQTILSSIRSDDCFIRWGGEEFILAIYDIEGENAQIIANKIVDQIYNMEFEDNGIKFKSSISIGGSSFVKSDIKYEDALARADDSLYSVKTHGKNMAILDFESDT